MFDSFKIAFATYSRIPMPRADWNERSMRYAMCFFPLVGAVLAVLTMLLRVLGQVLSLQPFFLAVGFTVLPVFLTGGIHLDGYLDTEDALHSYAAAERRLEILKDPHIGAFALIYGMLYVLTVLGCWTELLAADAAAGIRCIAWGFVLSRILSGLSVVRFPKARKDGMVRAMANAADRRVTCVLLLELLAAVLLLFLWNLRRGGALLYPLVTLLAAGGSFVWYRYKIVPKFGGTTGDLCGFFLCSCERAMLVGNLLCALLLRCV